MGFQAMDPGPTPKILTNPDFPNLKGRIHGHHVGIHNHGSKQCQNVAQEQICAVAGESALMRSYLLFCTAIDK